MTEWEKNHLKAADSEPKREIDDFWDIEKLIPERSIRPAPPPPRPTPTAVDLELPPRNPQGEGLASEPVAAAALTVCASAPKGQRREARGEYGRPMAEPRSAPAPDPRPTPAPHPSPAPAEAIHFVPPHKRNEMNAAAPLLSYEPDGVLLHHVKIYGWQANYHYFDSFVEEAILYDAMKPRGSAEKVTFFSYFPQYTQMNRRSEAWYLYWREQVRADQYPDTDYAYILLYLFELINLPTDTAEQARDHRDAMARVWMAYRRSFPQLDHYMCEWLCDYCLIHELTAPIDLLAPALDTIIQNSRLKEFYLSAAVRIPEEEGRDADRTALRTARILMRHCCQYDYRKSKFAQGEHKELFDSTIPAAVAHVLPLLLSASGQKHAGKPIITMLDSTVTRDAYTGALCSYRNKRRIEVAYTSFSRSHELRFLMGDMVKYAENRLRSWIGVRSRLSVMSLPIPLRDALDAYLNPLEPPGSVMPVKKKETPRPAYEALYDLPAKTVSTEDAAAIEAASWETTRILVEAFENDAPSADEVVAGAANDTLLYEKDVPRRDKDVHRVSLANDAAFAESTVWNGENAQRAQSGLSVSLRPYIPFIKAALDGDATALRAAAKSLAKMPDAMADEINALTADSEIGDIVLEDNGMGAYTVMEDYRDSIQELLHMETEN